MNMLIETLKDKQQLDLQHGTSLKDKITDANLIDFFVFVKSF